MNFNCIAIKMFKANIRRYLLYFLCSSFTIMIFFTYSTVFTNKAFMNPRDINSYISSSIIAPSIFVSIFSVFFIVYSHSSFNKYRKSEFGVFLSIGMPYNMVRKIIVIENTIIAVTSLIIGLIAGTILSYVFYFVTIKVFNVNVTYSLSIKSYAVTTALFAAIYVIIIASSLFASLRYTIINLLKEYRKEDKSIHSTPVMLIAGIVLIVLSIMDMLMNFNNAHAEYILRSMLICFAGTYLIISSLPWFIKIFEKYFKSIYYRNLVFISNIKYSFNKSKNVTLIIAGLLTITIILNGISNVQLSIAEKEAVAYAPYHIAYIEIMGKNNIGEDKLNEIINSGDTKLILEKKLETMRLNSITVFSDKNLNSVLGSNYNVKKGQFISLIQADLDDGYDHDLSTMSKFQLNLKDKTNYYVSQGKSIKILMNNLYAFSRFILILNQEDYDEIKKEKDYDEFKKQGQNCDIGYIRLFSFKDWKKTKGITEKLINTLEKSNNLGKEGGFFELSSRINDYTLKNQGAYFFIFALFFSSILFYVASNIMLHFKIMTDFEMEKVKYKKMFKIGLTEEKLRGFVYKELKVLFLFPVIISIIIGGFYNANIFRIINKMDLGLKYTLVHGGILLVLQIILYLFYRKYYVKKLIN